MDLELVSTQDLIDELFSRADDVAMLWRPLRSTVDIRFCGKSRGKILDNNQDILSNANALCDVAERNMGM